MVPNTLVSIHITKCEQDVEGWYWVYYDRCHVGGWCHSDSLTFASTVVENHYHAANKTIKTLCGESHYNTPRDNVKITYADFWAGDYRGLRLAEKETPVNNTYVVTFEYAGYTVYTDTFPLFEEALKAAIDIADDNGDRVEIEKDSGWFCSVDPGGSVEF